MSAWPRPTTADVALRAFSSSPERLLVEAGQGMQGILASQTGNVAANQAVRQTGEWLIDSDGETSKDRLLVLFLEEILYRCEVEGQWFVDGAVMLTPQALRIQASWVDADLVEREVEIKAVTRHELCFEQLDGGQTLSSPWQEVPDIEGPGWYCDVVFDI
jgi:SHS2 domain-containing protein